MDIFDLRNRVALVTGGGTGIGLAMAKGLASKGAKVILASRRRAVLEAAVAEIRQSGGEADSDVLDVTDLGMIRDVVRRTYEMYGRLDILVNNVGLNLRMPCLAMDPETWERVLRTNLTGHFFCAQAAARIMREARYGKIINVASVHSEMAGRNGIAYTASKGGVRQLTKALAVELAPYRISVNAIGPGTFPTEMTRQQLADPDWVRYQEARIPMGRIGRLDELAGAAIFFASSASDYVTGQILYVDGGYLSTL